MDVASATPFGWSPVKHAWARLHLLAVDSTCLGSSPKARVEWTERQRPHNAYMAPIKPMSMLEFAATLEVT
jgi:hypothetical protein